MGTVGVMIHNEDGEVSCKEFLPGQVIGEWGCVANLNRTATCIALTDVVVAEFKQVHYKRYVPSDRAHMLVFNATKQLLEGTKAGQRPPTVVERIQSLMSVVPEMNFLASSPSLIQWLEMDAFQPRDVIYNSNEQADCCFAAA